jgi:hypothetical protein
MDKKEIEQLRILILKFIPKYTEELGYYRFMKKSLEDLKDLINGHYKTNKLKL